MVAIGLPTAEILSEAAYAEKLLPAQSFALFIRVWWRADGQADTFVSLSKLTKLLTYSLNKTRNTMKTTLLSSLLAAILLTISTATSYAQKSGDEAAILKVIHASRTAFDKRNLTEFAACFVKSPDLYYQVYTGDGQLIMAQGWEAMTHMVGGNMKAEPKPLKDMGKLSDVRIHINGNTAWANGTSHWDGPGEGNVSQDFFVLEKQVNNGSSPQWKIAVLTTQNYPKEKLIVVK